MLALFVGRTISLYFLIWLMGMLIGRMRRLSWPDSRRAMAYVCGAAAIPFVLTLAWVRAHPNVSEILADFAIGVCFTFWLYVLLQGKRNDVSTVYEKGAKTLAGFSYTLYLTHFPALLLLRAVLDPQGNWQPDVKHFLYGLALAMLALVYAYVVAECTEVRTATVRRLITQPWAPLPKEVVR